MTVILDLYHLPVLHSETFGTDISNQANYYEWGPHQRVISPYRSPERNGKGEDFDELLVEDWPIQENRLGEITQEWDLNTSSLVQKRDTTIYSLLTDPQYMFPKILPDGTYKQ